MRKGVSSVARFAAALMMAVGYGTSWAAGTQTVLVNTVDELTNAVAQATKSGDYFEIVLKPGIYDLSNLAPHSVTNAGKTLLSWGTACAPDDKKESHLVFNVRLTLRGENTKHWSQKTPEEESVIKGNGTMRLLYPYTGAGRTSTFQHLSFENGHTALEGGAMYVMNTDDALSGKLTNCVFRNCSADETGGATFHLSAFDCLYENNTAPKAGAAYGGCGNSGYPTNVQFVKVVNLPPTNNAPESTFDWFPSKTQSEIRSCAMPMESPPTETAALFVLNEQRAISPMPEELAT